MPNLRDEFQQILDRLEKAIEDQTSKEDEGWSMKYRAEEDINRISRVVSCEVYAQSRRARDRCS